MKQIYYLFLAIFLYFPLGFQYGQTKRGSELEKMSDEELIKIIRKNPLDTQVIAKICQRGKAAEPVIELILTTLENLPSTPPVHMHFTMELSQVADSLPIVYDRMNRLLNSKNDLMVQTALHFYQLKQSVPAEKLPDFLKLLKHKKTAIGIEAGLTSLKFRPETASKVIDHLLILFKSKDKAVRIESARALMSVYPLFFQVELLPMLNSNDSEEMNAALNILRYAPLRQSYLNRQLHKALIETLNKTKGINVENRCYAIYEYDNKKNLNSLLGMYFGTLPETDISETGSNNTKNCIIMLLEHGVIECSQLKAQTIDSWVARVYPQIRKTYEEFWIDLQNTHGFCK